MGVHPNFSATGPDVSYQPKTTDKTDNSVAGTIVPHVNIEASAQLDALRTSTDAVKTSADTVKASVDTVKTSVDGVTSAIAPGGVNKLDALKTSTDGVTSAIAPGGVNKLDTIASKINDLVSAFKASIDFSTMFVTDGTKVYVRRETMIEGTGAFSVTIENIDGSVPNPMPSAASLTRTSDSVAFKVSEPGYYYATAAGTGISKGDLLARTLVIDTASGVATPSWYNMFTGATVSPAANTTEAEGDHIPATVAAAMLSTSTFQTQGLLALGDPAVDAVAADSDEGAFSIRRLLMRGLKRWSTLLNVLPAARGVKATADTFVVGLASDAVVAVKPNTAGVQLAAASTSMALASDHAPVPVLAFTPMRGQSLALTAGPAATSGNGVLIPAGWIGATAIRVRNPVASASPIAYRLADAANMPPAFPTAYAVDGTGGAVGDKALDPGAVEVFQLSATQQALLAAGTLRLSALTPAAGSGTLVVTPGSGI